VGKRAASCALFMSIFFDLSSFFMCDIDMFLLQTWLFPFFLIIAGAAGVWVSAAFL
jgi:hypothetical protein